VVVHDAASSFALLPVSRTTNTAASSGSSNNTPCKIRKENKQARGLDHSSQPNTPGRVGGTSVCMYMKIGSGGFV
jgi:hypothetical protein